MRRERAVLLGCAGRRRCYKPNANYPKELPMPFSIPASGLEFGAVACSGSSSCIDHRMPRAIGPGPVIRTMAPQLTGRCLAGSLFWKQGRAPEKSLRAETNPRAAGAACAGQPLLSGGEGWAAAGVHRQVNGSRKCCTIGFCLLISSRISISPLLRNLMVPLLSPRASVAVG